MSRFGRRCRHTGDFVAVIQQWLDQLPRSFERGRYVEKLDQYRDWRLDQSIWQTSNAEL